MRKRGEKLLKRIVAVALAGVMAPAALAEERVCRGTIQRVALILTRTHHACTIG
jgi:hypothetical protein